MKYISILGTFFFLFLSSHLAAQSNYRKGYIISNAGDTVRGVIDYRQWKKNPEMIKMKMGLTSDETKTLTVSEISAFQVDQFDIYERAYILIDTTPEDLARLNQNSVYSAKADTVFLRILLKSKISLYEFVDEKVHYYVREAGGDCIELMHNFSLTSDNRLNKSIEYKRQLAKLATGAENFDDLYSTIERAEYTEKDITSILEKLNQQSKAITLYKTRTAKAQISTFVGSGLVFSAMRFKGPAAPDVSKLSYSNSNQPLINIGFDLPMSRDRGKIVLRGALSYYRQGYEGTGTKMNFSGTVDSLNYGLMISHLSPSCSFLYNVINSPTNKFYLGAGASFNFSSYPENHYTIVNAFSSSKTELDPYLMFKKTWLGINGMAGYVFQQRYELATTVRAGGSFTNFKGFGVTPSAVALNFNYHFGK